MEGDDQTRPPTPKMLAGGKSGPTPASRSPRKKCQWCKVSRDVSQFARNPKNCNGYDGVCSLCRDGAKKMCTDKIGKYKTERTAIAAAIRVSGTTGKPWRHYKCTRCPDFHLTTKVKVARPPKKDTA